MKIFNFALYIFGGVPAPPALPTTTTQTKQQKQTPKSFYSRIACLMPLYYRIYTQYQSHTYLYIFSVVVLLLLMR